jgi:hypothetical protein
MSVNKKSKGLVLAAAPSAPNWPHTCITSPAKHFEWAPILLSDLHGVFVDWETKFQSFCASHGVHFEIEGRTFYDIGRDPSQSITPDQFAELFTEFVRLPEGYGALEPNPVVIHQMEAIVKAGIKLVIATYTPGATDLRPDGTMGFHHGIAQRVTKELIMKHLGHLIREQDIIFCSPSAKKHLMFEMHCPLIVEDHPVTAVDVATSAHAAILVPRSYNASIINVTNVLRLEDDNQLADAVLSFFEGILDAGKLAKA